MIYKPNSESFKDSFEAAQALGALQNILSKMTAGNSRFAIHGSLLDAKGDLIDAAGPNPLHYPVFEGCIKAARKYISPKNGETIITNDPYSGNTRQCDLLLFQGAFGRQQANELRYHVAMQVSFPELLNKDASKLFGWVEDEGFRIPPTPLEAGASGINPELIQYLCVSGISRETLTAELDAARSRLRVAAAELTALEQKMGRDKFQRILDELKKYSETVMRRALHEIPDGEYVAHDVLENDGVDGQPLRIQCKLTVHGENILLSFSGTSKQTKGPFNCNYVTTLGACYWVLRSMVKINIPTNSGAFKTFSVEAPDGTIVNARYPAPLLGGYYETSKRIADTLYLVLNKALPSHFPSQNGGSSNLILMKFEKGFHEELLGEGAGATKDASGSDAVMTDVHNSPATSIEWLERTFPVQVTHSGVRESSGGDGKFNGGNGLTRGYKFLAPGKIMLLSDRRSTKARGLYGGVSGLNGEYLLMRSSDKKKIQTEKNVFDVTDGDTLVVNTPGGGGWGKKEEPEKD